MCALVTNKDKCNPLILLKPFYLDLVLEILYDAWEVSVFDDVFHGLRVLASVTS